MSIQVAAMLPLLRHEDEQARLRQRVAPDALGLIDGLDGSTNLGHGERPQEGG